MNPTSETNRIEGGSLKMKRRLTALLLALAMLLSMTGGAFAEDGAITEEIVAAVESAPEQEEPVQEEPVVEEEPVVKEEPVVEEKPVVKEEPAVEEEPVPKESNVDQEAAQAVEALIDAIGTVTAESAQEIETAAAAYEALTDGQKKLVGNYAALVDAMAKILELSTPAEEEKNVYPVSGECGGALTWSLAENGALTISGKGEMDDYADENTQPWAAYAAEIRAVKVEKDVQSIGDCAFFGDYENLEEISLPDTLERIGEQAFEGCEKLEKVELPESLTEIGKDAFKDCVKLRKAAFAGDAEAFALLQIGEGNEHLTNVLRAPEDAAVRNAIALIDAIGAVSEDSGEAISAAEAAYEALTDAQKAQVSNYDLLTDAMAAYMALTAETLEATEPAADAQVTVTIANAGRLALVNAAVTVRDLNSDGILTYDEAMQAAHAAYCSGGYETSESSYGLFVTRLWNVANGGYLFFKNDVSLSESVGSANSTVSDGDRLYATVMKDATGYSDCYTVFNPKQLTVNAGEEFELTLTAKPYGVSDYAAAGAQVGTWENGAFTALDGKTTDSDGKVALSFASAGTYIVTAEGTLGTAPIMPNACLVTVKAVAIPATGIALKETALSIPAGETRTLTATVEPENATDAIVWTSSNEAVATVADGVVSAIAEGAATITAKAGEFEATCEVTVVIRPKLSSLLFRNGTQATKAEFPLSPAFDPDVREYTIVTPDSVAGTGGIGVWATLAEGSGGAIEVHFVNKMSNKPVKVTVTSGKENGTSMFGSFKPKSLEGNDLTIKIGGIDAYTIHILREPTLSALNFTAGEATYELTEKLAVLNREYACILPATDTITVNAATTMAEGVAMAVNGGESATIPLEWEHHAAKVTLKLSAEGARDAVYTVTLNQIPASLQVLTAPKTEYAAGDTFDLTGVVLQATYADGGTETAPVEQITFSPAEPLTTEVTEITLAYNGVQIVLPITVSSSLKGSGTEEDPWLIETYQDLETVRDMASKGLSFAGEHLKMVNDITLPDGWTPIGESVGKPFSGDFDGNGKTLTMAEGGLPLLSYVKGAKVANLNLYGKKIAGYGLVNNLYGVGLSGSAIVIDHVTLKSGSSTLKSGLIGGELGDNPFAGVSAGFVVSITNCTVESGVVIGYNKDQSMIGSIAGRIQGTISNCTSAATVYGTNYVGGVIGTRDNAMGACEVLDCRFSGSVIASGEHAGGIVGGGYSNSTASNGIKVTVKNCSASGSVSGGSKVGGVLGGDTYVAQAWNEYTFSGNSFTGKVSGGSYVGGVIGYYKSLNKLDNITDNYYASSCGAKSGFGFVEYVDTNCETHETESGATYFNTETSTAGCPSVTGCNWKKAHNRTDDPLGADAAKLMRTDGTAIVPVDGVSLDQSEINLKIGETQALTATVTPENATDKTVTWASSDATIATVQDGVITAQAFGTAVITAQAGEFTAQCAVNITAEPAESVNVYMTVSDRGVLAKTQDGSAMFNRSVTVADVNSDGVLTYDEALIAAHAAYCPNGYVSANTEWGVSVSKLWGVDTMNCLFYLNDSALKNDVGNRETSVLHAGDYLVASVNKDNTYYSDHYTTFDKRSTTAVVGQEFRLSLKGSMGSDKIAIGYWENGKFASLEGAQLDADGNVKATFTKAGTYLLTAGGTIRDTVQDWSAGGANVEIDCPIIAPGCWVKVEEKSVDPEAKPVQLAISGSYKKTYAVGDKIDLTGMVLTVTYSDGTTRTIATDDATVNGFDTETRGEKTVTIAYEGVSASFTITVTRAAGTIDVTVSVLGDSRHGTGKTHTLANGGLTTWVKAESMNVKSGATVWEALRSCLDEHKLSYENPSGNYISSVNGLAEFDNGKNSGWMYTLNGKYSLLGVSEQKLKDGDRIVLHYTDDYTAENTGFNPEPGEDDTVMVDAVEKLIENIGAVTLDDACKARIDAARRAYDKLSYAEKKQVDNYDDLKRAEAAYSALKQAEDQKKADAVIDLINQMGGDQESVRKARAAYNALTAEQKKLVTNYKKLTDAEYALANKVATGEDRSNASGVADLIDAIGNRISDASEAAIRAARRAYDKLSDTQKALVTNIAKLEAAEEAYARLNGLGDYENLYRATGDALDRLGVPAVGSIGGEWRVIGLARSGRTVDEAYLAAATEYVKANADANGRLNANKSTDNARLILALTALGADVTNVDGVNLLSGLNEMAYIEKQGVNGPIWALIALDSNGYEPEGDVTREALIACILNAQLADGGWAYAGEVADADMTAMALTALAGYYDPTVEGENAINAAVKKGIECLSELQLAGGGFGAFGPDGELVSTSESVSQVIVALTALGVDPDQDERFIKEGVSALDALVAYGTAEGFKHLADGEADAMATEQGYYALTAYARYLMNLTRLYDMTDVFDAEAEKIEPLELYIAIAA